MISHSLTITLNDMRQVHKGIINLTCLIHHPGLFGLAQKAFQTFAHNRASDIEHEIGDVSLIIAHKTDSLVKQGVHRLTSDHHRTLSLEEPLSDTTQCRWQHFSSCPLDLPFCRQFTDSIVE